MLLNCLFSCKSLNNSSIISSICSEAFASEFLKYLLDTICIKCHSVFEHYILSYPYRKSSHLSLHILELILSSARLLLKDQIYREQSGNNKITTTWTCVLRSGPGLAGSKRSHRFYRPQQKITSLSHLTIYTYNVNTDFKMTIITDWLLLQLDKLWDILYEYNGNTMVRCLLLFIL